MLDATMLHPRGPLPFLPFSLPHSLRSVSVLWCRHRAMGATWQASWWRCYASVGAPPTGAPRAKIGPTGGKSLACSVGPSRGATNCWEKFYLKYSRGTSKLSIFTRPFVGLFSSMASGRMGKHKSIWNTLGGEAAQLTHTWPDNQKPRICILGGGFGGLYTALRLESLVWRDDKKPQVLLVDQSDHFVFKPMLYELLSGEVDAWEIAPSFTDLLKNTSIQFLKDKVKQLCPSDHLDHREVAVNGRSSSGGLVYLESGLIVEYDWLVLALGAETKLDAVPGSAEFAFTFSTLEDASKVDNKLKELERDQFGRDFVSICVAVVGCGYSGVELAATISERLQNRGIVQAINVETAICPNAAAGNREAALKVLSSRNTQLFLGYFVSCIKEASTSGDSATMNVIGEEIGTHAKASHNKYILELQPAEKGLKRQILEADLVLWTVGLKPLVSHLELSEFSCIIPLNARGQVEIDETLRIKGHPRIFAIGDSAAVRDSAGRLLPATAQVAFQQADFAGWNLWAAINDRPLLPFRFQNLGEMMTLGRYDAAISPSFIEGLTLDGPLGHAARKMAYLLRLPTDEHRAKVGISWLMKSAVDSVALLQSTLAKVLLGS